MSTAGLISRSAWLLSFALHERQPFLPVFLQPFRQPHSQRRDRVSMPLLSWPRSFPETRQSGEEQLRTLNCYLAFFHTTLFLDRVQGASLVAQLLVGQGAPNSADSSALSAKSLRLLMLRQSLYTTQEWRRNGIPTLPARLSRGRTARCTTSAPGARRNGPRAAPAR